MLLREFAMRLNFGNPTSFWKDVCFFFLCCFAFISSVFPGSGIVSVYGISARMFFAAGGILFAASWCVRNYKMLLRDKFVLMIGAFIIILLCDFIRSVYLGHRLHLAYDYLKGSFFFHCT